MSNLFDLIKENKINEFSKLINDDNINIKDNFKNSLLHYAIKLNNFDVSDFLINDTIF